MNRTYKICIVAIILLSTAGCDQLTKKVAKSKLAYLEYAENFGAFLSLGENLPKPILLLLSSVMAGIVILLLIKLSLENQAVRPTTLIGLSLIGGGSIGNLIDRLLNIGAVVDFLRLRIGPISTGIFNLADVAIMAGAMLLLISLSRKPGKMDAA